MKIKWKPLSILMASILLIYTCSPVGASTPQYMIEIIGQFGTNNGDFDSPTGVLVVDGKYYVADYDNDRIQVFDSEWNYIDQFGGTGSGLGQLNGPLNVASNGTFIFVADYINERISVFDLDGNFITTFGSFGTAVGELSGPSGIAIENGIIYVTEYNNLRFQRWNESTLEPISIYTLNNRPFGIDVANGLIYIADSTTDQIRIYEETTLIFRGLIGTPGDNPGGISLPVQLKVINSYIVLSEGTHDRIIVMDKMGNVITEAQSGFDRPYYFDIGDNQLIVPNSLDHNIAVVRITPNPFNVVAESSSSGIQLSWEINNLEGIVEAESYNIYRETGGNQKFLGTVIDRAFFDHTANSSVTYSYSIEANSILGSSDQTQSNQVSIDIDQEGVVQTVTQTITEDSGSGGSFDDLSLNFLPFIVILLIIPLLRRYNIR